MKRPTGTETIVNLAAKLTARGVEVNARHLGEREGHELVRAFAWAELGEADRSLHTFLRPFLKRPIAPLGAPTGQLSLLGERTAP